MGNSQGGLNLRERKGLGKLKRKGKIGKFLKLQIICFHFHGSIQQDYHAWKVNCSCVYMLKPVLSERNL